MDWVPGDWGRVDWVPGDRGRVGEEGEEEEGFDGEEEEDDEEDDDDEEGEPTGAGGALAKAIAAAAEVLRMQIVIDGRGGAAGKAAPAAGGKKRRHQHRGHYNAYDPDDDVAIDHSHEAVLREACQEHLKTGGMTQGAASTEMNLSPADLSLWIRPRTVGHLSHRRRVKIFRAVHNWLTPVGAVPPGICLPGEAGARGGRDDLREGLPETSHSRTEASQSRSKSALSTSD